MHARIGVGQYLVAQDALVDLAAVLLGLAQGCFGRDLGPRRHEARHQIGRVVDQPLDADELAAIVGQPVVERPGVTAQEDEPRVAAGLLDDLGDVGGGGIPVGLGRQAAQAGIGLQPVGGEGGRVGSEIAHRNDGIHGDAASCLTKIFGAGDGI